MTRMLRVVQCLCMIWIVFCGQAKRVQAQDSQAATNSQSSSTKLPADVHPDSFSRLPLIKREEMDDYGKKVYDALVNPDLKPPAGLQGMLGVELHSPRLAEHMSATNRYLRAALGARLSSVAILVTARELNQQFHWTTKEMSASEDGLEQSLVDVIKFRKETAGLGEKEAAIIQFGRELLREHRVSSSTYAQAKKLLGEEGVVNLAALMGAYAMSGIMLDAVDIQFRPYQKPLLPMP